MEPVVMAWEGGAAVTGFFVSGCLHEYVCIVGFRQEYLQRHLGMRHMRFFLAQVRIEERQRLPRCVCVRADSADG